jgi:hypothetical protein
MSQPKMTVGPNDRWGPRLHPGSSGPSFDLVGTSWTIVVHETREAKRMTCWFGSFPAWCTLIQIVVTLSDMSDRLSFLSPRSMSYYIDDID